MFNPNRRRILKSAGVLGTATAVVPGLLAHVAAANAQSGSSMNPLAMPPEITGELRNGQRVFELSLEHGSMRFFPGLDTPTIGINRPYLGPVIRVRRNEKVLFRIRNRLTAPSTLHWHGLNLPAVMDGGPHQVIPPGGTWESEYVIRQPTSTQWYHSHLHRGTGFQVYHGLAGMMLIDDPDLEVPGLPVAYGIDDIPLVIQDRSFNRDGSLLYIGNMHDRMAGMLGNRILVNGSIQPTLAVTRRLVRLRILNGSNARIYNLAFSDHRSFTQVASDGGFLDAPVVVNEVRLGPGERAEVLVPFERDDRVILGHKPLPQSAATTGMGMMRMMASQGTQPFPVMGFHTAEVGGEPMGSVGVPTGPGVTNTNDEAPVLRHFRLAMPMGMGMGMMMSAGGGFTINGRSFDMNRIDLAARKGESEIWTFRNDSPMTHPVHIHNVQFRILSRNGRPPPAGERGPKDTVLVEPDETVRLGLRFLHYANDRTPYMFHCHNLEHEDQGMMGQFVVV